MNETILVCILSGSFGLIGVLIGVFSTYAVAAKTARIEERKHFRELGVAVGRAKFDQSLALAQQLANASGKFVPVPPLDAHLIHGIRLMEIISDSTLSAEQIGEQISELTGFTKIVTETVKSKR